jgi:hypothetical protein
MENEGDREQSHGVQDAPMTWPLGWSVPSGRYYPRPPSESRLEPHACGRWVGPFGAIGCDVESGGFVDEIAGAQLVPKCLDDDWETWSWTPAGMPGCPTAGTFQATRPRLVPVPAVPLERGSTFEVHYRLEPSTDSIAKAVLVHPGCGMHSFDFEQRYVELECEPHPTLPSTVRVSVPADGEEITSGSWMLFLVTQAGIPSEATFVHLQR